MYSVHAYKFCRSIAPAYSQMYRNIEITKICKNLLAAIPRDYESLISVYSKTTNSFLFNNISPHAIFIGHFLYASNTF